MTPSSASSETVESYEILSEVARPEPRRDASLALDTLQPRLPEGTRSLDPGSTSYGPPEGNQPVNDRGSVTATEHTALWKIDKCIAQDLQVLGTECFFLLQERCSFRMELFLQGEKTKTTPKGHIALRLIYCGSEGLDLKLKAMLTVDGRAAGMHPLTFTRGHDTCVISVQMNNGQVPNKILLELTTGAVGDRSFVNESYITNRIENVMSECTKLTEDVQSDCISKISAAENRAKCAQNRATCAATVSAVASVVGLLYQWNRNQKIGAEQRQHGGRIEKMETAGAQANYRLDAHGETLDKHDKEIGHIGVEQRQHSGRMDKLRSETTDSFFQRFLGKLKSNL